MAKDFIPDDEMAAMPSDAEGAASQGWGVIGNAVGNILSDTPTQEAIVPTSSPIDLIAGGIGGRLGTALASDAESVLGNEIGSLGNKNVPSGGISVVDTAPKSTLARVSSSESLAPSQGAAPTFTSGQTGAGVEYTGLIDKAKAMFPNAKTPEELAQAFQKAGLEGHPIFQAVQQALNRSRGYADGGEVTGGESPDFIPDDQFQPDDIKYGSPLEQAKTAIEGAAQGVAGPLAPMAEKALGVSPEAMRGREAANPTTHTIGEAGGFLGSMVTGVGEAPLIARAGEAAAARLIPKAATTAAKIGSAGVKTATEMGLFQTGDEVSKMIKEDPDQSVGTALMNIGLAGAMGGAGGAAIGAVSPLWSATLGNKAAQLAEDFRGQVHYRLNNPEPHEALLDELTQHYSNIKGVADDVYGPAGLKAQDIEKALPHLHEGMLEQSREVAKSVGDQIGDMVKNDYNYSPRLTQKLQADLQNYVEKVSKDNLTSSDVFNATQDLKQTIQDYAKYDKFVKPTDDAYQFVKDAKGLASDLREKLEDKAVWGKAAERQQAINKAFSQFNPALKDFEKKFTSEVSGERVIDPGKVQTYLNQVDKASGSLKKNMLKGYIDAAEKYSNVIADTHHNLGMENPLQPYSMTAINKTLEERTHGAKLADLFVDQGLPGVGGRAMGAAIGSKVGAGLGSGMLGAVVGERVLGPFLEKVLPGIAKPLLTRVANAQGFKAAVDYGVAVARGETAFAKAAKNVFKASGEVLPESMIPTERDRAKLEQVIASSRVDNSALLSPQGSKENVLNHYLPEHGASLDMTKGNVAGYINSVRPDLDKKAPLDSKPLPSTAQKAAYNNALNIAQQPMVILSKIAKGTLTPQDITAFKTMYPALYPKFAQKLTSEMIDSLQKGVTIPYRTRVSLSAFMGQPLDSSMTPVSIISNQQVSVHPVQQQNEQGNQPVKHGSSNALNKLPGQYQTKSQMREAARSKASQ